jgi:Ran GTPase-activating protein (RanGAP) involved in mRNA processing and transport
VLDHIRLDGDVSAIQFYLEQSLSLLHLSLIDCDLTQVSYLNIAQGIKHSRSLESADLSRNRVMNVRVAESISNMLQGCLLKSIKMRHCDINDHLGQIIFTNIRKNKNIEKIDLMNNLLGDETAKKICEELKHAKSLTSLLLDENIIKYKDMQEINSYLSGNKYFTVYQLDKEYQKLQNLNNQLQESGWIMNTEN